ncbi:MAG: peroxidase-related enzyme [Chloroflexales bacterium]|nr:peroxidase-related enzyme [Chloroflexales bacterium]
MSEERISRLPVPAESELPADIQELFAKNREKPGFVPNVFRALSLRPEVLRGFIALYDSLMAAEGGLTKVEREMIAVAVSAQNHCHYCLVSHGAVLRVRAKDAHMADTVAANYRVAGITPRQRAMLDYAVKLTRASAEIGDEDLAVLRAHGFGDGEIFDITQIAAFFNYSNRAASALGMRPNAEFYGMGR